MPNIKIGTKSNQKLPGQYRKKKTIVQHYPSKREESKEKKNTKANRTLSRK